jgi:plasmid stabilization system protein ParE
VKLRYTLDAVNDAEEIAAWLAKHRPQRHDVFLDALDDAFQRIRANPRRFPRLESTLHLALPRDLRRCTLRSFQNFVVFELRETGIVIVAVSHPSRSLDHWLGRLKRS